MNRRSFLSALGLGATAAVVDPERLLWTPTKTIFVPPAMSTALIVEPKLFRVGDVVTFAGYCAFNPATHRKTGMLQQFVVTATSEDGCLMNCAPSK